MNLLLTGARIAPCVDDARILAAADCIAIERGAITFVGSRGDAPEVEPVVDVSGRLVTPGLVDAHTHLVWGGDRLEDFARRTGGASYAEMQEGGGGILSTVRATAASPVEELVGSARRRLEWLARSGVTTAEVKSGYGMIAPAESMMLGVAELAGRASGVRVERTLLGAHAVPEDGDTDRQVERVITEMIPAVVSGHRAVAVDVFADSIAFSADQMARMFTAARAQGLDVKAHVGQIADVGAARVAAQFGAMSVDHCEHVPEEAMRAIAAAGTVAVLVPGASMYLADPTVPPVEQFRQHGIPMAVTTDLNPGSSPLASLPTAAALAIHRFGLTPTEGLLGITSVAARALRLTDGRGRIEAGGIGDLAIWSVRDPLEIVYWINAPVCAGIVIGGRLQEYETW